jgi:flagellar biogenesis protein FliO
MLSRSPSSRRPGLWLLVAAGSLLGLLGVIALLEAAMPGLPPSPALDAGLAAEPAERGGADVPALLPAWRLVVAMLAVAGVAAGAAVLLKRFSPLGRRIGGERRRIRVVEVHPLGGKRFLCLVRVDSHELVLGLSPSRIDLLTEAGVAIDEAGEPCTADEARR